MNYYNMDISIESENESAEICSEIVKENLK